MQMYCIDFFVAALAWRAADKHDEGHGSQVERHQEPRPTSLDADYLLRRRSSTSRRRRSGSKAMSWRDWTPCLTVGGK